jgi:hypothetical protein
MPNWKKVIVSGSDASLNSLNVTAAVTASIVSASAGIITDNIQFNTSTSTSVAPGQLAWNNSDGTLDLGMKGGNVVQQIGQEIFYEVRNDTGTTIQNGTALYASGVTAGSGRITAEPFTANGAVREVRFLGMATEDISNGANGFVTHFGYVRGLDTRGNVASSIAVGDETWAVGDILYAHPTVAGKLTNVRPKHEISVAIIIVRHQNVGIVFVRPASYGHLDDIHDVSINTGSLATGDLLIYNSGSDLWINTKQLSGSYGLTGSLNATSFIGSLLGTASFASTASFINVTGSNAFVQNGNSFGATALLGTNDNQSLAFETNGVTRMFVSSSGIIGIGTSTPAYTLDAPSGSLRFVTLAVGNDAAGSAVLSTSGNYMFVAGNNNHDVILPGLFALRSGAGYGVGIQATQYPAVATSAILTLTSTTKGLLTPRTNLTSNISAPAQGLLTYITSSATEGLYYYNSGSYQGWTRLLNNTGSQSITGSLSITQNITASRVYISSSNGTSNGPTLTVYGSGSAQPVFTIQGSQGELFSVTDSLSGSLYSVNDISGLPILEVFSDNTILMGSYIAPSLNTTTKTTTTVGSNTIYTIPTASYTGAFFEYTAVSASNARAGSIMAIHNGGTVRFTETTTTDIGTTTGLTLGVIQTGGNFALTGSSATAGWTIKTIVRSI